MAMLLKDWIDRDVNPYRDKPLSWLSQYHFFRDPVRSTYSDPTCFFSPADGVVLYQRRVDPDDAIIEIKGLPYSVREALRDPEFNRTSLVVGVFMTFFDVHVNRVPYAGRLSYREHDPIDTYNHPMLNVEKWMIDELRIASDDMDYLHSNQRVVNRVYAPALQDDYYILQIADYDVDCITPFQLKQNQPVEQGERFSQIRYGSQVDLIVPLSRKFEYEFVQKTETHVEAGIDPLIRIREA